MELVQYHVNNRIAYITMNRAEKRNALSPELVTELKTAFSKAASDDSAKVIVLKGEGKAFSAGADLAYLQSLQHNSYDENLADSRHLMELFELMYHHPKVIIAQVEGHAIAGGCGLATVCDFCFAVPKAKMGYTEVKIGFIPAIVMVFLVRKIGEGPAKELLLTGKLITSEEAKRFKLINDVVEAEGMEAHVYDFAQDLIQNTSGQSLGLTKQMLADVQHMPWKEGIEYAAAQNAHARATEDCKKGIGAFLNKEAIVW